jgi:hypothetical protein
MTRAAIQLSLLRWARQRAGVEDIGELLGRFPKLAAWEAGAAHALAHRYTVVTHEVASTGARKIKIPNACIGLGLHCVSPYEMLRRERARFVLGGERGRSP